MEKICLDFETTLDFLRGDAATIEKLKYYADREEICITSFTMLQLLETVSKQEVITAFVNSVTVLPFDRRAAHIAADILTNDLADHADIHKRTENVLTAAICIANEAFLYAKSPSKSPSKFEGIKGLKKV